MEHAILNETIDGQKIEFYPETGFDDVINLDTGDTLTTVVGTLATTASLNTEIAARAEADTALGERITANATALGERITANATALGERITANATALTTHNSATDAHSDIRTAITDAITTAEAYTDTEKAKYLPLSGGTINGSLNTTNGTSRIILGSDGTVELFADKPFIDFHYNNSTSDYTSRIIDTGNGLQLDSSPATTDNSTKIATTAFVNNRLNGYCTVLTLISTVIDDIEASWTAAGSYTLFSGSSTHAAEYGWYGFKHTESTTVVSGTVIIFSHGSVIAGKRLNGTWTMKLIGMV